MINEKKLKKDIEKSWEEVREKLCNKEVEYNETDELKKLNFFDRFDNALQTSGKFAATKLSEIDLLLRSCNGESHDKDRFIALKEGDEKWEENKHRLGVNRYNEPKRGFMYFGISMKNDIKDREYVKKTCAEEIRVFSDEKNKNISTLEFKVIDEYRDKKVLDFSSISKYKSCDDLLMEALNERFNIEKKQRKTGILTTEMSKRKNTLVEEMCIKMYLKLVNDSTFKYTNKSTLLPEEIKIEYAPFHAFANYIESMGYSGIIYNSTVHKVGLNLVLFDRDEVEYFGEIVVEEKIK